MNIAETFKKYWKKPVFKAFVIVFVALIVTLVIRGINSDTQETESNTLPSVSLASASSLSQTESVSLIGTVRAFTEAQITTERAGRVTSVSTSLGSQVGAGQIIATLENASEQAAVLQAQGVYEAALANAAQSTISVEEAQTGLQSARNSLVTSIKSAYNTANSAIRNDIDDFYGNPDAFVPGLKLDGKGQTQSLNAERVAFQTLLSEWQQRSNSITTSSNLEVESAYAVQNLNRTISLLDTFITLFPLQDANGQYSEAELQSFSSSFTGLRGSLLQAVASIESAQSGIERAEDAALRAEQSATGGTASAADAQVKQALGSLRAAQANLAKTILRTPISGTVNSLDIKVGDFVGSFETVSIVANNNALEIVTYVGDTEKDQLAVGETVVIEGEYEGIITQIAPAVDAATRKTEVRIATDNTDISNGDTVRITKDGVVQTSNNEVFIPITAVKFEAENGYVFKVENETLVRVPVTIGQINSSNVEITSGLSMTDEFVLDARGLNEGASVNIK